MSKSLNISRDLEIPLEVVTETIGLVGQRGSGKTHATVVLAEELIKAGQRVCILDPLGVYYGLRLAVDGKARGLDVVILGGEHADVPLEPGAGKAVADWFVTEGRPCVVDLWGFRKAESREFVTAFAEEIFRKNREPMHLIVDEADLFAPQRPMPGEQRMLGAFEDLVRRGRSKGIGLSLATQRPAVIHKDILTQVSVLMALRIVGPQDRQAVEAWIKYHGSSQSRDKVLGSLSNLAIGQAWFWSPGWLQILKLAKIRVRETFDSSATPKVGMKRASVETLPPVDIEALRQKFSGIIERAKDEDPKVLRRRITELERKFLERPPSAPVIDVGKLHQDAVELLASLLGGFGEKLRLKFAVHQKIVMSSSYGKKSNGFAPQVALRSSSSPKPQAPGPSPKSPKPQASGPSGGLRRMLVALAQRPDGLTRAQIGARAGLSSRSGSFSTYLSKGRTEGWLDGEDKLQITSEGLEALGEYEALPTGKKLLDYWLRELGQSGTHRMLAELAEAYPRALTKDELAQLSNMSERSGSFSTYLSKLRSLELVTGKSELRMSEELS